MKSKIERKREIPVKSEGYTFKEELNYVDVRKNLCQDGDK